MQAIMNLDDFDGASTLAGLTHDLLRELEAEADKWLGLQRGAGRPRKEVTESGCLSRRMLKDQRAKEVPVGGAIFFFTRAGRYLGRGNFVLRVRNQLLRLKK